MLNIQDQNHSSGTDKGVKKPTARKVRTILLASLTILVVIVVGVVPVVINIYADVIIGRMLQTIIRNETKNAYQIEFEKVGFNLFKSEINFQQIHVFNDTTFVVSDTLVAPDSISSRIQLDLTIPHFHLRLATVYRAIRHKELLVEHFEMQSPDIKITHEKQADAAYVNDSVLQNDFKMSHLHNHIKNYFALLKIDRFAIGNANLLILTHTENHYDTLKISNISLRLTDFHLDSMAHLRKDRLFFSDSIALWLDDGKFRYRSNQLEITFDHLDIASQSETVTVKNVAILQDSASQKDSQSVYFSLDVPEIKITGLDVLSILDSNALIVRQIELFNPDIILNAHNNEPKQPTAAELTENIFRAATAYFHPLKIDEFGIVAGSVVLPNVANNISIPQFSLSIYNISMDSLTYDERSPLYFADEFSFSNKNQKIEISETGWEFFYDYLALDTRSNKLTIENLVAVSPDNDENFKIDLMAPSVVASGYDFKNDFLQKTLTLKNLTFQKANINLDVQPKEENAAGDSVTFSMYNLYPLIEKLLKLVTADVILMDETEVNLNLKGAGKEPFYVSTMVDLSIDNFRIDEHASDKQQIFYASGHNLRLWDFCADLPGLGQNIRFEEASLETQSSKMKIKNLEIERNTAKVEDNQIKVLLEGIGNFEFAGFDFAELYYGKGVFADSVKVLYPDFQVFQIDLPEGKARKNRSKKIPYYFDDILISDGKVAIFQPDGSHFLDAKILNLVLNEVGPGAGFSPRKTDLTALEADIADLSMKISGTSLKLAIERLTASSSRSTISGSNLVIDNSSGFEDPGVSKHFTLKMPEFTLHAFPFLDVYHKNVVSAGSIHFSQPVLEFTSNSTAIAWQSDTLKERLTFKDFDARIIKTELLKLFHSFDFDFLRITDGSFRSFDNAGGTNETINVSGVDVDVEQFMVTPETTLKKKNLLFAANIIFKANHLNIGISAKDRILISNLLFATASENLAFSDLRIVNNNNIDGYSLTVEGLSAEGLAFHELIMAKNLGIESLKIKRPQVSIYNQQFDNRSTFDLQNFNAYLLFSDHFNQLKAGTLIVENARVAILESDLDDPKNWIFDNVQLILRNISIDSTNHIFNQKIFYADDLNFIIRDFSETAATGLYDFGASLVEYTHSKSGFVIENGYLTPNYPEDKFAELAVVQTDRMAFNFERLRLSRFKLTDWLLNNQLKVDKLTIDGFLGNTYRDKRYPFPQNHFPPLPASALHDLDFEVYIDTLLLRNSEMTYREYVSPALKPGKIFFTNLNLVGRNITNEPVQIAKDSLMRFYASARLMDEGRMEAQLDFNLKSTQDEFRVNGVVNAFDLTCLNPLLEQVAFVGINSGKNELISFNFLANNEKALGNMRFTYNKLQIRLIDKDKLEDGGSGEGLASFLANTFVVRGNNPAFLGGFREGEIYFSRDVNKSIFNFLAKSVLSGLSSTIRGGSEERREKRRLQWQENQEEAEN